MTTSQVSSVVTGGAQGVGRAIVDRLCALGPVIVVDVVDRLGAQPDHVRLVTGDARDPDVAVRAAALAERAAPLTGWVNNAAIFRDARLDQAGAQDVLDLVAANVALAVIGCHTAVNHYRQQHRSGAIVNVSSHQAQRPVRGALPYATAKAAVEGLTRAVAVDHGPDGIRTNAVALGSISTDRYEAYRATHPDVDEQMAALHPLGRVGTATEAAETVAFLLSPSAGFINGVVLPIDGGRAANGPDPESA